MRGWYTRGANCTENRGDSGGDVFASSSGVEAPAENFLRRGRPMGSLGGAVWRWRGCGGGGGTFKGRGGAGGVQKTMEILQVPFVDVSQNQFIGRVCPSSCEQRQVSTGVAVPGQGC